MSNQLEIDAILEEAESTLADRPEGDLAETPPAVSREPATPSAPRPRPGKTDLTRILRMRVPVIVRLAHRPMRIKDIMKLASGSIIEFDKAADGQLDLMINNEIIGHGQGVKVGENFGLRVLHIMSLQEKIMALRGEDVT